MIRETSTAWRFERKDGDMHALAPSDGAKETCARPRRGEPDYTPIPPIVQDEGQPIQLGLPGAMWYTGNCVVTCATGTFFAFEVNTMSVHELEATYQRLRDQLLDGDLDEEQFRTVVDLLRFVDKLGNEWKIGWHTGKWYRHEQGQWIQGRPVEETRRRDRADTARVRPTIGDARWFSSTPCLVILLIGLLVAASVLLIFGWNADWWQRSREDTGVVAQATATGGPTSTPSATATSEPTASPTPSKIPSPTATRQPTATRPPATPTAAPTQTGAPTASATTRAASSAASTASVRPTATASLSGHIYFPVYDPNPDRRTFDIYVVDLESGEREIMLGQASQPALSPNGGRLAYRSWDINSRGIRVRELSDGSTWAWIGFHEAEHPSWSPDNLNLVFSSQQESDRKWRLYRTIGPEIVRVDRDGGDIFGRVPTWSADGRIVYWECPMGNCGLHTIQPDGTGVARLTNSEQDTAPAVSPDGSLIVFMSSRDGDWEIYLVSAYQAGADPQQPSRLTNNTARDGLPTWSPDGRWIAFASDRGGAWAIWAMRPDGSGQQKLFPLGGPLLGEVANVPPTEQHGWTSEGIAWGK